MKSITLAEFDRTYQSAVDDALGHWTPGMQAEIALHNPGWREGATDFEEYLRKSVVRYHIAYESLAARGFASICDVGGFWGVFPVTLRRLSPASVTMTESLQYYSSAFDGLFEHIRAEGVEVIDYDPFSTAPVPLTGVDAVVAMAVIEHYPHSLKRFMANLRAMLAPDGRIYIEAPNIAYWPKRTALLRGRTPLVPSWEIWQADEPFIGHHHEFTMAELTEVCSLSGLSVVGRNYYNYSGGVGSVARTAKVSLRHPILTLAHVLLPDSREVLSVLCEPRRGEV